MDLLSQKAGNNIRDKILVKFVIHLSFLATKFSSFSGFLILIFYIYTLILKKFSMKNIRLE